MKPLRVLLRRLSSANRPRKRTRLRVEALEQRTVPSQAVAVPPGIQALPDPLYSSATFDSTGAVTRANAKTGQGSGVCNSRGKRGHAGTDLAAPLGTPVHAVADGVVTAIRTDWHGQKGRSGAPGNFVVIQHVVNGVTFVSEYFHLMGGNNAGVLGALHVGDRVFAGETIGAVGNTGNAHHKGFVPHLHFEVHVGTTVPKKNGFPSGPSYCPTVVPPPPYVPPPPPPPPCSTDGDEPYPGGPDDDGDFDC